MSTIDASALLRPGLLQGVPIVLALAPAGTSHPAAGGSLGCEVADACAGLGARVLELPVDGDDGGEQELGEMVEHLLAHASGELEVLVIDGAGLFVHALARAELDDRPEPARVALRTCLDASWSATHALVSRAFLPGGRGGRIVYLTPPADAGEHAGAACRGLENLARTLSIEWARHGITTAAVLPASGSAGHAGEVATLTAYLASPAGAYFSGCLLDLSGLEGPADPNTNRLPPG